MTVSLKPAQAYCKRCERLFCYFKRNVRRKFCSMCVSAEKFELLEFSKAQRLSARILREYEEARAA